jgi:enamine deaminase RidA (YjgF/YER057c/UK114 family)
VAGVQRLAGDPPSPWEQALGYSRVVVAGPFVKVGGTTSVGPEGSVLGDTPYEQTIEILRRVVHELGRAGAGPADVIETRFYVTDISRAEEVVRAFHDVLGTVRPVTTMVQVSALIDPRLLVEIETTAYVAGSARAASGSA